MTDERQRMEYQAEALDAACIALHGAASVAACEEVSLRLRVMADECAEAAGFIRAVIARRWPA